ncbi:MAG TPA: YdeI/OmpD-associated family protein [Terriglobales bacterium]|nr:YdeI/OmpD-associated family protein [Terriglobales bacterium]
MKNSNSKRKSFRGTLEHLRSGLGWVIVRIPFDVKKTWGGSRVKVRGEVNGATFRTSVFPQKDGSSFLLINKQVQKAAGIVAGSTAQFHVELDTAPREVQVPVELTRILAQSKRLQKWFDSLSYSFRQFISRWVAEPKSVASRERRADQMAERMMETMEAERELPPLIRLAFERSSLAREGWDLMTPRQRRGELLAVFYYRTPEARARRLQKTLELAKSAAARKTGRVGEDLFEAGIR